MMTFDPDAGIWSPMVFWYITVNSVACFLFVLVIIVGGVGDLRYLFRALAEAPTDETDDGRVAPGATTKPAGSQDGPQIHPHEESR